MLIHLHKQATTTPHHKEIRAPTLSAGQLSILQYQVDAGDRIAYYTTLSAFGFTYGALALGVVLYDTTSGAAANRSFLGKAGDEVSRKAYQA